MSTWLRMWAEPQATHWRMRLPARSATLQGSDRDRTLADHGLRAGGGDQPGCHLGDLAVDDADVGR